MRETGFDSLLRLSCNFLCRDVCHYLVQNLDPKTATLTIQYQSIHITDVDVGHILGIPYSGRVIPKNCESLDECKATFSLLTLNEYPLFWENEVSPLVFKRAFILYVLGTFLCPTTSNKPSPKHYPAVVDVHHAKDYNWGKYVLDWMLHEITHYKKSTNSKSIGGCLLFLQVST